MKHLNFLTKSGSQSGSHRVVTLASTVGSPSAHRRGTMLKLLSVLVLILTFGVGQMWGAEEVIYTLTPYNTGTDATSTGYGSATDASCEDEDADITITWNVTGNTNMVPWRIGGKGGKGSTSTYDRVIYSKNAISNDVTKIVITHGAASSITVNSMTVVVSTAQNGGGTVTSTLTPTFAANGDVTINRPAGKDWSGKYYKINYNVSITGDKNKFLEFSQAEFFAEASSCEKIGAPTVTATPGDRQIVLEWPKQAEASSYTVTCPGGTIGSITGTSTKSCTITGLTNGTAYTWTVTPIGDGTTYCAEDNTAASASATPNVSRTITYYDKDGQHTTSLTDGTNIATALNALYGVGGPTSCNTTDYNYFVGWKDGEISGTASSVTLLSTEVVNATTAAKSYYAVWSDTDPSAASWSLASSIAANDVIVLAYVSGNTKEELTSVGMINTNSCGIVSNFTTSVSGTFPLTVVAGNSDGSFSFKNGNNYLSWSSGNTLTTSTTKNDASSWNVSFNDNSATITNVGTPARYLKYNTNDPRICCYTTSGTLKIYKQAAVSANYITNCCTSLGSINGSVFWTTHFYPVWPEKHRLKGYYTNLGITSVLYRIPHHLIYTMYISRDFE